MQEREDIVTDSDSSSESVATTIKKQAVGIYKCKYKFDDTEISPEDLQCMTCGLSAILDLNCGTQKGRYTTQEWEKLKIVFIDKYKISSIISTDLYSTWTLVCKFCEQDNNVYKGMNYLAKFRITALATNPCQYKKYLLFEHVLQVIEDDSRILQILHRSNPDELKRINEQDIVHLIWAPIFNKVLNFKHIVSLKTGETTTTDQSTMSKQELHHNHTSVAGFKIDFRFISSINEGVISYCYTHFHE